MLQIIFSSFALVAASEMGDKTQLLAFSLAARFKKPWPILSGIFVATLLNHALASTLGSLISSKIAPKTMDLILAVIFVGFGFWTLKPDTLDESKSPSKYGPFVTTVILFFLAEMGDKTQFATVALAAEFHSAFLVTIGTTLGMMVSDGLAVFLGDRFAHKVQMHWVRYFAASLFFIFGIYSAYKAFA
jgi:putative Ca2+/H+ antiporter (TMEM165/GDT1 family)